MPGMSRTTRFGLFILGFFAATGVEAVRADEAYLCEGGRVVKVPFGKLEEMKRTDACIASYYGETISSAPRIETGALPLPDPAPPGSASAAPPPASAMDGPRPGKSPALKPRALSKAAPEALSRNPQPAPPVRAAAGTDYRNVVLLNAAPGNPQTFRHER